MREEEIVKDHGMRTVILKKNRRTFQEHYYDTRFVCTWIELSTRCILQGALSFTDQKSG